MFCLERVDPGWVSTLHGTGDTKDVTAIPCGPACQWLDSRSDHAAERNVDAEMGRAHPDCTLGSAIRIANLISKLNVFGWMVAVAAHFLRPSTRCQNVIAVEEEDSTEKA